MGPFFKWKKTGFFFQLKPQKNNGKEWVPRALFSSEVPTSQTMFFFFLRSLCVKTLTELIEFANYILNWFLKGLKEYSEWLKLFSILTLQARDIIFSKVAVTSKNLDIKANTKKKPTKIKKFAIPLKS